MLDAVLQLGRILSLDAALQLAVGGILLGGVYALLSLGLTIVFGVARILNLAHGDMLMLGALVTYLAFIFLNANPLLLILALAPLFFAFGLMFERILVRPVRNKPVQQVLTASILVTVGAALVMEDLSSRVVFRDYGVSFVLTPLTLGNVVISSVRLLSLILIVAVALFLHVYIRKTFVGKAIRAITDDYETAAVLGINISRISAITFGIGTALAAIAGLFVILITNVNVYIGLPMTVKAVTIVVLGGLGSLLGSVVAAILLGVSESLVGFYVGQAWSGTVALFLLILILILRPQGLFGRTYERV